MLTGTPHHLTQHPFKQHYTKPPTQSQWHRTRAPKLFHFSSNAQSLFLDPQGNVPTGEKKEHCYSNN